MDHSTLCFGVGATFEEAFRMFGAADWDFCGENGTDYLWNIADKKGFLTNLEYVLDATSGVKDPETRLKKCMDLWLRHDSYYSDYTLRVVVHNGVTSMAALLE